MRSGAPTLRRVTARELAYARCWAEGLDLLASWRRYLGPDTGGDLRQARADLRAILESLQMLARSSGRGDIAVLLRRDPEAMASAVGEAPTLEAFAREFPPDLHGESELLALYRERHGDAEARSPARRRRRLRERLVGALQWAAEQAVRSPAPGDGLAEWLDARVARRLATAGLSTVGDLHARVCARRRRWHRGIARVGPVAAERIVRWLREHEAVLGPLPRTCRLPPGERAQPVPGATGGPVPLERFVPPAALDGASGGNRVAGASARIDAADDRAAIEAWLARHEPGSHTWRAYRKEAERWLLWAVLVRRRAVSALDGEDCEAYRRFLAAPALGWTAPRATPRASSEWRPFEAALSARSQDAAVAVLRSLCRWLVRQRYLAVDPWDLRRPGDSGGDAPPSGRRRAERRGAPGGSRRLSAGEDPPGASRPARPGPRPSPAHGLGDAEWCALRQWVGRGGASRRHDARVRLRCLLELAADSGLRLSEIAQARLDWLRSAPQADGGVAVRIAVPAEGGAGRGLALSPPAVDALRNYLGQRGVAAEVWGGPGSVPSGPGARADRGEAQPDREPADPGGSIVPAFAARPLIARLDGERPLSAPRIAEVLVATFRRCAAGVAATDPALAQRLRTVTARALRHRFGLRSAALGLSQAELRHRLGQRSGARAALYLEAVGRAHGRRGRADAASGAAPAPGPGAVRDEPSGARPR